MSYRRDHPWRVCAIWGLCAFVLALIIMLANGKSDQVWVAPIFGAAGFAAIRMRLWLGL